MADSQGDRVERQILELIDRLRSQSKDRLPTETELAGEFAVGRHTLRKAIDKYVTAGILEKIQGKGTFLVRQKKGINFSGWIGTEPPGDLFIAHMISTFETRARDLGLQYMPIPYYQTVDHLIRLALTGKMPDVMQLVPHFVDVLHRFGVLRPLDAVINHNDLRKRFPVDVESGRIEKKLISLSWALSPLVLYCNKVALEKAGLDPETVPGTLEELHGICRTINSRRNEEVWGICLPLAVTDPIFLWLYPYFLSFGGGFSDVLGNITIDSEQNAAALRWMRALSLEGAAPGVKGVIDGRMLFAADRIAFWVDGPWMKGLFHQLASERAGFDSHYRIARIPVGPSGRSESVLFSHHLAVSARCEDVSSACRWIDFLTTDQNIIRYYFQSAGCLPPMRDVLSQPFFRNDPFASVCIDQMETASAYPLSQRLFTHSISFVSQAIQKIIVGGREPEQMLAELRDIIQMIGQSAFHGIYSH